MVDTSDWLYEITAIYQEEILKRVQEWVGTGVIKEISYQVGEF
jgi:hypothetical protein